MKRRAPFVGLCLVLSACGGVRDRIHALPPPASARFDARELIDVLPPGRIPAIDHPRFSSGAGAAEWLDAREPVVVVSVDADARAYPLAILVWHEVVDDTIGGVPLVVTYSPLCNAALAFDRRVGGRTESFSASGKLYRSDLVMVDRRSKSLWTQLNGRAVAGPAKGSTLAAIPAQIASLAEFRDAYPAGSVLARPEGTLRGYGFNPYAGYDARRGPFPGFFALALDRRLPAMDRIVGVADGGEAHAFRYRALEHEGLVAGRVGGRDIVVLWRPDTRSALDTADMSKGHDVGSAGVFHPVVAGRRIDLSATADGFRDRQTGSTWNVLGVATAGTLRGERLEAVPHADAMWFAWAAFYPGTVT